MDIWTFVEEMKKLLNMKVTVALIVVGAPGMISNWLVKWLKELKIKGEEDHSNYSIIKICQNTEKFWEDLRRVAITNFSEKASANAGVKNSQRSK